MCGHARTTRSVHCSVMGVAWRGVVRIRACHATRTIWSWCGYRALTGVVVATSVLRRYPYKDGVAMLPRRTFPTYMECSAMIISNGPAPSWATITSMCLRTVCDKNSSEYQQASARKQLFHIAYLADKAAGTHGTQTHVIGERDELARR